MTGKFKGKCILIVEDDLFNAKFYSEIFMPYEVDLLFCETAEESIELIKKNKQIDIVLMDIKLPKKSGLFATREIKSIRKDIPVIAQTAYALEEDKRKILESGCDAYIAKPVKISELFALINKFLF
ncbi:MAG: response regulator [Bacteroidales bacterium]|nr:response regulator [Bacteroidales bacterium]MCF8391086.1 response regulator [Bacteroidales bacterium]